MSQQIRVLQCSDCKLFQVDIVKKAKKWQCKVCNVKQFTGKVYLCGSGPQCRLKAQELNMDRGKKEQLDENNALELLRECEEHPIEVTDEFELLEKSKKDTPKKTNKWAAFLETSNTTNKEEATFDIDDNQSKPKSKKIQLNYGLSRTSTRNLTGSTASKREYTSNITHSAPNPKKQCSKWQNYV